MRKLILSISLILVFYCGKSQSSHLFKFVKDSSLINLGKNIAVSDFNNDGYLDLATSKDSAGFVNYILILLNKGDSSFVKSDSFKVNLKEVELLPGDFSFDNTIDIAMSGTDLSGLHKLQIYKRDTSSFSLYYSFNSLNTSGSMVTHDFNGDGKRDILINASFSDTTGSLIFLARNNSRLFDTLHTKIPVVKNGGYLAIDYDMSGFPDVLVHGNIAKDSMFTKLYINKKGHFKLSKDTSFLALSHSKAVLGDYDLDGNTDIAMIGIDNQDNSRFQIYLKRGLRYEKSNFLVSKNTFTGITMLDFDHDGRQDILLSGIDTINNPFSYLFPNRLFSKDSLGALMSTKMLDNLKFNNFEIADFNNDGNADILDISTSIIGFNISNVNKSPKLDPPFRLFGVNNYSFFIWNKANDDVSPSKSIGFDLYLKRNEDFIQSPELNIDNFKRKVYRNSFQQNNNGKYNIRVIRGLENGLYTFFAYPIDNANNGGEITTFSGSSGPNCKLDLCHITPKDTVICTNQVFALTGVKNQPSIWFSATSGLLSQEDKLEYSPEEYGIDTLIYFPTETNFCDYVAIYNIISVDPLNPQLPSDTMICKNNMISLTVSSSLNNIKWYDNSMLSVQNSNIFTTQVQNSHVVILKATDKNNCKVEKNIYIKPYEHVDLISESDTTIVQGNSIVLSASNALQYTWYSPSMTILNSNDPSVSVSPMESNWIYVKGKTDKCYYIDSIYVKVNIPDFNKLVFIPELFSPNGDGNNDEFRLYGENFKEVKLIVKDRDGRVLFETTQPEQGWDGTYNGMNQPSGLYFWQISGKFTTNRDIKINASNTGIVRLTR